jgi:hypothetical protein
MAFHTKPGYPSHAEIYVSGKLQYLLALTEQEKNIFVDTELGGVNVKFQNKMVRVTSSNSPLKLCVKQGWIKNPGETIIGIPDKLIIKIIASSDEEKEFDSVIR